jgi:hypothetical protein
MSTKNALSMEFSSVSGGWSWFMLPLHECMLALFYRRTQPIPIPDACKCVPCNQVHMIPLSLPFILLNLSHLLALTYYLFLT